jgi:hypothetical protein
MLVMLALRLDARGLSCGASRPHLFHDSLGLGGFAPGLADIEGLLEDQVIDMLKAACTSLRLHPGHCHGPSTWNSPQFFGDNGNVDQL